MRDEYEWNSRSRWKDEDCIEMKILQEGGEGVEN